MSMLPLNKRPLQDLESLGYQCMRTLRRGKHRALAAMSRLNSMLMDIDEVLAVNEHNLQVAEMRKRKRLRLSRGTNEQTVLATQTNRCERINCCTKYAVTVSNVADVTKTSNSRKRPRDETNVFYENNNDLYEILLKNSCAGQRDENLNSFDCRQLLKALLTNEKTEARQSTCNDENANPNKTKMVKSSETSDANKKKRSLKANSDALSQSLSRNSQRHVQTDTQKQKDTTRSEGQRRFSNEQVTQTSNRRSVPIEAQKQKIIESKIERSKDADKKKSEDIGSNNKLNKTQNKENSGHSTILHLNNIYKEIMNSKEIKKEADAESVMSDATKELYEMLAGN